VKETIMKALKTVIAAAVAALLAGPALAQMDMPGPAKPQGGGMDHGSMSMTTPAGKGAVGTGTVKKVDPAKRMVNLSHGPIPAINWPAMTMDFPVAPDVDLGSVKAGQSVEFTLAEAGGGKYTVTSIKPSK
jgi:Cu(I)/Ag(I) efflux system protein CusF